MQTIQIKEGAIKLIIPKTKRIYGAPVFYNPNMTLNRDISTLLVLCLLKKSAAVLDLLAATGVRAIRFTKEVGLKNVYANDANPAAVILIKKNAKINKTRLKIFNLRAHEFLAQKYYINPKTYFDYIDVDPFGTPVPFLDAAVKALVPKGGILAITATDTANLCGVNTNTCRRLYQAIPLRSEIQHEFGIRILLKKIIETGAQYNLALSPIFCHSTLHYMRVYLRSEWGAKKADEILKQIGLFENSGPIWLGKLWDEKLVEKMYKSATDNKFITNETKSLLFTIKQESKIPTVGFYDLAKFRPKQSPKISDVIAKLHAAGFTAARTHFSPTGIRTSAGLQNFKKLIRDK